MGIGRIHDVFATTVGDLQSQAAAQAKAAHKAGDRKWQKPEAVKSVLDIQGIGKGFDREAANANFGKIISGTKAGGTTGDAISVKTQVDYVAVVERAFRARHCTPVRCLALAIGRRDGHGKPNGIFGGGVQKYAQDVLKSGQG
jgi:hypothetical protein